MVDSLLIKILGRYYCLWEGEGEGGRREGEGEGGREGGREGRREARRHKNLIFWHA